MVTDIPTSKILTEYPFKISLTHYPANWLMAPHMHPYSNISVVIRGKCFEETNTGNATGTACSLVIKPRELKHENKFGPMGAIILSIQFNEIDICEKLPSGKKHNWQWIPAGNVNEETFTLLKVLGNSEGNHEDLINAVYSLIAALQGHIPISGSPPHWINRVKDKLQNTPEHPHRVEHLAAEFGTHPVYLARVFKQYFHKPISEYLRCLRLQHAVDQMASSDHSLSEIAFNSGFADQSHFGRTFKSEFKTTPNTFRKILHSVG